jgi:hypothetical protein
VIALEMHPLEPCERLVDEHIEDIERPRSAVHVVAKVDDHSSQVLRCLSIGDDTSVQLIEKIDATVDIADGIDPPIAGNARRAIVCVELML